MPNINLPFAPTDGNLAVAAEVMTDLYDPEPVPESFEVINGWLDNANRKTSWDVVRDQIRPGSMSGGRMVGLTGNLDYLDSVFPSDASGPGASIALPGASINFRLPFAATVVLFTWQIVVTNDSPFGSDKFAPYTDNNRTELRMKIDGVQQSGQFRVAPDTTDNTTIPQYTRQKNRERVWSGHFLRALSSGTSVLDTGWHSAGITIFNLAPAARVRIRNFKYMYWR